MCRDKIFFLFRKLKNYKKEKPVPPKLNPQFWWLFIRKLFYIVTLYKISSWSKEDANEEEEGFFVCGWCNVSTKCCIKHGIWYDTVNSFCVKSHFDGRLVRVSHVFNSFFFLYVYTTKKLPENCILLKCVALGWVVFFNHDNDFKHFRHNSIFYFYFFIFFLIWISNRFIVYKCVRRLDILSN